MRTVNQTTISGLAPTEYIKTTKVVDPELKVKEKNPQVVYEEKKTLFKLNQIIWYILGVLEILLSFRILLKLAGANPGAGFTTFIYGVTYPFVFPFQNILGPSIANSFYVFEWSSVIAAFVYACVAWGLVYLLDIFYPITPKDVDVE